MYSQDSSEAEYNEKLVAKLRSNRARAVTSNQHAQLSRKQRNMLLEARRTQRQLVGESEEYRPHAAVAEQASPESKAEANVDAYTYIKELDDLAGNDEEIDLQALFDDAAVKMRDNIYNNEVNNEEETN